MSELENECKKKVPDCKRMYQILDGMAGKCGSAGGSIPAALRAAGGGARATTATGMADIAAAHLSKLGQLVDDKDLTSTAKAAGEWMQQLSGKLHAGSFTEQMRRDEQRKLDADAAMRKSLQEATDWVNNKAQRANRQACEDSKPGRAAWAHLADEYALPQSRGWTELHAPPTFEKVRALCLSARIGAGCGFDHTSSEMLAVMGGCDEFVEALTALFGELWNGADPPEDWADSAVSWLYKKGDAEDCANYRGISLMSIVAKLWEKHIADKITIYLELNGVLHPNMLGFRSKRCCIDAVAMVLVAIAQAEETGQTLAMCFIDIRKAFPRVNRDIMLQMLALAGITGPLLGCVLKMYGYLGAKSTRSRVKMSTSLSRWYDVLTGLLEGSRLSPLLFIVFANHIYWAAASAGFDSNVLGIWLGIIGFADDKAAMAHSVKELQRLLLFISDIIRQCLSTVSAGKTRFVQFGPRAKVNSKFVSVHMPGMHGAQSRTSNRDGEAGWLQHDKHGAIDASGVLLQSVMDIVDEFTWYQYLGIFSFCRTRAVGACTGSMHERKPCQLQGG